MNLVRITQINNLVAFSSNETKNRLSEILFVLSRQTICYLNTKYVSMLCCQKPNVFVFTKVLSNYWLRICKLLRPC